MKANLDYFFSFRKSKIFKDVLNTTFLGLVGHSLNFFIPFFIAAWFGISAQTDVLFFAYGIVIFLSGIFSPVVESVIVPFIAELEAKGKKASQFLSEVLGTGSLVVVGIWLILIIFLIPILSFFTKFSPQQNKLIFQLLLESMPLFLILVWNSLFAGTLNAYKKFSWPAFSPFFSALVKLGSIFLFKNFLGVHAVILGYSFGELVRLLILNCVLKRENIFNFSLNFYLSDSLKNFFKIASFQSAGMVLTGFNPLIDNIMASWLGAGSISLLEYASRLFFIPVTFFNIGLLVVIHSNWSEIYYQKGAKVFKQNLKRHVLYTGITALFISIFLIIFKDFLVALAYSRGSFPREKLKELSAVWVFYLLGFAPYILSSIYARAHLVVKNLVIFIKYPLIRVVFNFIFNLIFMLFLGVKGIAISTAVCNLIIFLGLIFELNKFLGGKNELPKKNL